MSTLDHSVNSKGEVGYKPRTRKYYYMRHREDSIARQAAAHNNELDIAYDLTDIKTEEQ